MQIFITGTDTDVGKTVVCGWLCLHSGFRYWKPIQTGVALGTDRAVLSKLNIHSYPSQLEYNDPVSPHLAGQQITFTKPDGNLIIEGAGGVLVPIDEKRLMVDLVKEFGVPVILVATTKLGTINHTLLSLEALRNRRLEVLGVILNGEPNIDTAQAIEFYGHTKILANIPPLAEITRQSLLALPCELLNEPKST